MRSKSSFTHKILVADDEKDVRHLVASNLQHAGFSVVQAQDGPGALETAKTERPDLIVLDLMMPGMSGIEVCKVVKADPATAKVPIIMLTARAEEIDRVVGFELGADDYVTKPFSPRELVLRVQSVLRRLPREAAELQMHAQVAGAISLDPLRYVVEVKNKRVDLTTMEFKLLALLMERRGKVQTRDGLLSEVWAYEAAIDTRTVDAHIRRLREKLGTSGDCIETVRGFGYRLTDQPK